MEVNIIDCKNVGMLIHGLLNTLKKKGYKFFPAYPYLITLAINKQGELHVAVTDGVLGLWKTLTPARIIPLLVQTHP